MRRSGSKSDGTTAESLVKAGVKFMPEARLERHDLALRELPQI